MEEQRNCEWSINITDFKFFLRIKEGNRVTIVEFDKPKGKQFLEAIEYASNYVNMSSLKLVEDQENQ